MAFSFLNGISGRIRMKIVLPVFLVITALILYQFPFSNVDAGAGPIETIYGEETTEQTHTGDSLFVDVLTVASSSWTANATYILIATADTGGNSSNNLFETRLVSGDSEDVFTDSHSIIEPESSSSFQSSYYYVTKYTAPTTPQDIRIQHSTANSASTVETETIVLLAIRLDEDLTENEDWFFATTTNQITNTTSFIDHASSTFTPLNNNDDWLVFGNITWYVNNAAKNFETRIRLDGTEAAPFDDAPFISEEGEDGLEQRVRTMTRVFTLSNSEHTFTIQTRDSSSAGSDNDHKRSAIVGLRLNAFEDHLFGWEEEGFLPSFGSIEDPDIGDQAFTPSTAGDFIFTAFGVSDASSTASSYRRRIQIGGTTHPTGINDYNEGRAHDARDETPIPILFRQSLAASAQDIDFDWDDQGDAHNIEDRSIAIFSVELADAEAPAPADERRRPTLIGWIAPQTIRTRKHISTAHRRNVAQSRKA